MNCQKIISDYIVSSLKSQSLTGLQPDNIYGQIDPDRLWADVSTLEVSLDSSDGISDCCDYGVPNYSETVYKFAIHAVNRQQAFALYGLILTVLEDLLSSYELTVPPAGNWCFVDWETFPDNEGSVIQTSYWAVFRIKIYHPTETEEI